jgi:hypothetical protein
MESLLYVGHRLVRRRHRQRFRTVPGPQTVISLDLQEREGTLSRHAESEANPKVSGGNRPVAGFGPVT